MNLIILNLFYIYSKLSGFKNATKQFAHFVQWKITIRPVTLICLQNITSKDLIIKNPLKSTSNTFYTLESYAKI